MRQQIIFGQMHNVHMLLPMRNIQYDKNTISHNDTFHINSCIRDVLLEC